MKKFLSVPFGRVVLPCVAAALLFMLVSAGSAKADTISQNVSFAVGGTITNAFPSNSLISYFNPADGTLTGITLDLTGALSWTTSGDTGNNLNVAVSGLSPIQSFYETATGSYPISIDLTGTDTNSSTLSNFTGMGSTALSLLFDSSPPGSISYSTVSGTIVYDYTPVATPEPSSLLLLGAGLLGLAVLCGYKKRAAQRAS